MDFCDFSFYGFSAYIVSSNTEKPRWCLSLIFHTTQHDVLAQGHMFLYVQSYDSSLAHDVVLQGLSRWSPTSFNINLTTSDYIHKTGLKTPHTCPCHASSQSSFISMLIYQDAQAVCWWVCEGFPAAEDLTLTGKARSQSQHAKMKEQHVWHPAYCLEFWRGV